MKLCQAAFMSLSLPAVIAMEHGEFFDAFRCSCILSTKKEADELSQSYLIYKSYGNRIRP